MIASKHQFMTGLILHGKNDIDSETTAHSMCTLGNPDATIDEAKVVCLPHMNRLILPERG